MRFAARRRPKDRGGTPTSQAAAPVAVPVGWDELDDATPDGWTLDRLGDRLEVALALGGDEGGQALPVEEIVAAAREAGVDLDTPHDRFGRER